MRINITVNETDREARVVHERDDLVLVDLTVPVNGEAILTLEPGDAVIITNPSEGN